MDFQTVIFGSTRKHIIVLNNEFSFSSNVLYLNLRLSSFCKNADETILYLFFECNITKELQKSLISFFDKYLNLPYLTPQTTLLGFTNTYSNTILLKNHILLLFKIYLYNSSKCNSIKCKKM